MKTKITLLILLVGMTAIAQIKGNKTIETRSFNVDSVEHIKINFYAKVTIDQSAKAGMQITTDSNLFDLIDTEVVDGVLHLNQKEWISPSQNAIIYIGVPNLKRVESGTHDTTKIINVDNDELRVNAPIGNIIIEGKTKELRIGSELATIDASKIIAENAYINLWHWGKIKVNVTDLLWADVSNDGKLIYVNKPKKMKTKTKKGGRIYGLNDTDKVKNPEAVYISFKIKNNSSNRNHFEVVGPKPDGSKFGYGFPMMPNTTRKENWTVGTKIYKVNSLGFRKLLITIKKENENKTVNLF
ncbi:GIN domain-containing protein [Winogradskyella sp. R77965]|uniref:GIN domain-containing protein n=1 Tax=Winogradskyella sp. R77965 TaxID=3093872 RepID=UPI0037DC9826